MKFSQLEFKQKRLNHRIRAILEAIEPELNSFGRLADLFLTAGAELRESALSAISRAVNEKTLYEMRNLELQIAEIDNVIRGKRDAIREKSLEVQTERANQNTQYDFDAAAQEILGWKKEISDQEQLKTPLVKQNSEMRKSYFSVTAQNSIFRAAFVRLEQCAENLGYPTAKAGLSSALYGANYKDALSAIGTKTATPQAKAKKQYAPSPAPNAPIMAQVAQQAIGKAAGQPAQQNAPAPAPAPAQAGPKIKRTGKKSTIILPNGNQVPLGPATPAPTQQTTSPVQATPPVTQAAAPAPTPAQKTTPSQPPKATAQSPIDSLSSIGDKLQDQNAKKYLAALVGWFKSAIAQTDLTGGSGTVKNGKSSSWLLSEYVKIIQDQIEMGLVRADANMQKEEYRREIDPNIFDASVFKSPAPTTPFNDKFDASLRSSDKVKFGQFELDGDAIRLRYVFDNNLWPVISADANRLAAESQTFFRPEDVQQIKKVVQESMAQNIPLEERLKGVADEKGLDPKQIAALATIVQISLPDEPETPEVTPEVTQQGQGPQKVMPGEPFSERDVVDFLQSSKKAGIKKLQDLQPVVQKYVGSLSVVSAEGPKVEEAEKAISDAIVHSRRGETYDVAGSAIEVIMADRPAFRSMIAQAMMERMPETGAAPSEPSAPGTSVAPDQVAVSGQEPSVATTESPSVPKEKLPPITKNDIAEFLATTNVSQITDLAPLVSRAVAGFDTSETDVVKTVAAALNLGIGFVSKLGKSPARESAATIIGMIAKDKESFVKMIESEVASPSQSRTVSEPGSVPTGPLDLSQVVQKGVESLRALERADAQSMRSIAGANLKSPETVSGEASELLQTLKTGGLNAMLSSVAKYLKR